MTAFLVRSTALIALALPTAALADVWVAKCNEIVFRFDRTTKKASIFMKTSRGTFQLAGGSIGFDNGTAVRAPLAGLPDGVKGPMTEVGLNRDRNIVYVLYRNPDTGQVKDGIYCATPITLEN